MSETPSQMVGTNPKAVKREAASVEPKRKRKTDKSDVILNIVGVMHGVPSKMPAFPAKYRVLESADGTRVPIEIGEKKVLRYVTEQAVQDTILRYSLHDLATKGTNLKSHESRETYCQWRATAQSFDPVIKPIAEHDDDTYCWHRLPWTLTEGPTPTFDEMFSRFTDPVAVKVWIGSLLVPEADKQQYLWVYGEGGNGKSRLAAFLHKVLGPAARAEQVPDQATRRFWTYGLLGKRLILFPDCSNYGFPSSGFFKGLTGDDAQRIERKGKDAFDANLDAKFLFLSNEKPSITSSTADQRRAIYVELGPLKASPMATAAYDRKLWTEGPAFLHECLTTYKKACPDHQKIHLAEGTYNLVKELAEDTEDDMESILFTRFTVDEKSHRNAWIKASTFQEFMRSQGIKANIDQRKFKNFLRRKYGVQCKVFKEDGKTIKRYEWLCERSGK